MRLLVSAFVLVFSVSLSANQPESLSCDGADQSTWGYLLPLPYFQLSKEDQFSYKKKLPLTAVGAVLVNAPPFRATSIYLGKFHGIYLFSVSAHVVNTQVPSSVELGQIDGQKFLVPVSTTPLFSTMNGDLAILRSQDNLPQEISRRLEKMKPAQFSFSPVSLLMSRHPGAQFFSAGRGKYGYAKGEQGNPGFAGLWTRPSVQLWDKAAAEAEENIDENPASKQGDIFVVSRSHVLGNGITLPMRDPDGLKVGEEVGDPFLSSPVDWAPEMIAVKSHILGRMSGSPLFMRFSEGLFQSSVVVVGIGTTLGVPENLNPLWNEVKMQPLRLFGDVIVAQKDVDGQKVPYLSLIKSAPLSYMSSVAAAGNDLSKILTDLRARLSEEEHASLKEFFEATSKHN